MLRWSQPEVCKALHTFEVPGPNLKVHNDILQDGDVLKAGKHSDIVNGAYTARWDEAKQHYAVYNGGTFVTSAKKEEKAHQHMLELSASTHKLQKKVSGAVSSFEATTTQSSSRPSEIMVLA